jgi:hypothetical protein
MIRPSKLAGVLQAVGALLAIQGLGSAVAQHLWNYTFGIPALIRRFFVLPWWGAIALGAVGVLVFVFGLWSEGGKRD